MSADTTVPTLRCAQCGTPLLQDLDPEGNVSAECPHTEEPWHRDGRKKPPRNATVRIEQPLRWERKYLTEGEDAGEGWEPFGVTQRAIRLAGRPEPVFEVVVHYRRPVYALPAGVNRHYRTGPRRGA